MKDNLQVQLEMICTVQLWAKKQILKKVEKVEVINTMSINSVKQKLI